MEKERIYAPVLPSDTQSNMADTCTNYSLEITMYLQGECLANGQEFLV